MRIQFRSVATTIVPVEKRKGNFDEIDLGFTEEQAVAEAKNRFTQLYSKFFLLFLL